jgi:hypothetical protein
MLLQAPLLHGVALHINSRLHKNGPKCVGFMPDLLMPSASCAARVLLHSTWGGE